MRLQQFRLRFALSLRHRFGLLFQQFVGLNARLRVVRIFDNDLRSAAPAVFLHRREQSRQSFIGVLLRFRQSFGNDRPLHFRRVLL